MASRAPSRLLVVCKTHLDVGFTDLAATVVDDYLRVHLPAALATAATLRTGDTAVRLRWTVGSWLVSEALERGDAPARRRIETAIAEGDLVWHAWPFTTHTGLLDPTLAADALGLSARLDRQFGRRTRAAKMTDVPGHPRALVPILAEAGVTFLHVGVNPASRAPDVPSLFRWHDAVSETSLHVAYEATGYGGSVALDADTMLVVAHTGDNLGPPTATEVSDLWGRLAEEHPGATIEPASLDDAADVLEAAVRAGAELSEVHDEIGDTWIHGAASDPVKLARYRALVRVRAESRRTGLVEVGSGAGDRATRALLLAAEHTWGLDQKTHLPDSTTWSNAEVTRARATEPSWQRFEASWAEQRSYVDVAASALADAGLAEEVRAALVATEVDRDATMAVVESLPAHPGGPLAGRHTLVELDAATGALHRCDTADGRRLAGPDHLIGHLRHQTFDAADYERWWDRYVVAGPDDQWWARADQTKPGLDDAHPAARSRWWPFAVAAVRSGRVHGDRPGVRAAVVLAGHPGAVEQFGCPAEAVLIYDLPDEQAELGLELCWFAKTATRFPEATWCSFAPRVGDPLRWRLDVLGEPMDPSRVVPAGGRHLQAVGRGAAHLDDGGRALTLESLDAALIAPGRPALLDLDDDALGLEAGLHVCLHNNVWGTNFPMWCDDDARFRFRMGFEDPRWWTA